MPINQIALHLDAIDAKNEVMKISVCCDDECETICLRYIAQFVSLQNRKLK